MNEHLTYRTPNTAQDALRLWDAGESVPAFEIESDGQPQHALYAHAFEQIRGARLKEEDGRFVPVLTTVRAPAGFTQREMAASHSVAYVAVLEGWEKMVKRHLAGGHIQPITVKKS
jgi:hypothetical protein